jgi:predicted transcriptional regulator
MAKPKVASAVVEDNSLQQEVENNLSAGKKKTALTGKKKTEEVVTDTTEDAPKTKSKKKDPAPSTAPAKEAVVKNTGVSGLVREMLTPAEGSTVAGATFSDVNKAVQARFGRKLHQSEFQRNFDKMVKEKVLTEKAAKPALKEKVAPVAKVKDGEAEKETGKVVSISKGAKMTDKQVANEEKKAAKAEHKKLAKKTEEVIASGDSVTE